MAICEKCCRPVSRRMGGECMACRYREARRPHMKMKYFRHCPECGIDFSTNNSLKTFCSNSCERENRRKKLKLEYREKHPLTLKTCRQCGKQITNLTQKYYCSAECRTAWTYAHKVRYFKKKNPCPICGRQLPTGRRKYCSDLCTKIANGNCKAPDGWIQKAESKDTKPAVVNDMDISDMFPDATPALQDSAGWGCIEVQSARQKPAGPAKIRINISRLPYRGEPTKDKSLTDLDSDLESMFRNMERMRAQSRKRSAVP